ncbi:hypothetical protein X777_07250, partial [Ooceraea biroi]
EKIPEGPVHHDFTRMIKGDPSRRERRAAYPVRLTNEDDHLAGAHRLGHFSVVGASVVDENAQQRGSHPRGKREEREVHIHLTPINFTWRYFTTHGTAPCHYRA